MLALRSVARPGHGLDGMPLNGMPLNVCSPRRPGQAGQGLTGSGRLAQRLCVTSNYGNGGRSGQQRSRQPRPPRPPQFKQEDLAKFALPALGAVSVAMLVGPLIAGERPGLGGTAGAWESRG